ncbi:MAG: methyltransferase, partial [Bdellovibrionales bacterium]|nr:methyltransferase [Bdellovibrionales bacterium]
SLFVGGLGLGSLLLPEKVSPGYFIRQIFLSAVFLAIAYVTGPYWSIWLSHVRVALTTIPFNWYVFKVEIWLFLFLFIFPIAFFMGRLLPLSYYFLKKRKEDYGTLCGYLYFFNTLGTVFGAVVIGYLAFYFFDLDSLFKINLGILILLFGVICFWERRRLLSGFAVMCLIWLAVLPQWNRTGHLIGYFRQRILSPWHFQKMFFLPKLVEANTAFFDDGPNATVSILTYPAEQDAERIQKIQKFSPEVVNAYSLVINGKSDGHSINDFSTVVLLSSLGYLFLPEKPELSSAVVGLGTGISAGVLGKLEDMKEVVVLEISPAVISGLKSIRTNFDFSSNPKVKVIERDAFRYFSKTKKKFDFIVSEPSNPWVMGMENLFAREFYQLANKKLNKGGVLAQWLHTYSMDAEIFRMVCHTLKQEFKYVEVYLIGFKDVVILASQTPFYYGETVRERFSNAVLSPLHRSFGLFEPDDLHLIRILDSDRFAKALFQESGFHSLTVPRLTYKADKAFFLSTDVQMSDIFSGPIPFLSEIEATRIQQFKKYLKAGKKIKERCLQISGFTFFCSYMERKLNEYDLYKDKTKALAVRFDSYSKLRNLGLIEYDEPFIKEIKEWIVQKKIKSLPVLLTYVYQTFSVRGYEGVQADVSTFQMDDSVAEKLKGYIKTLEKDH